MPLLKNYTYLVYLLETTELKYMKFIDTWWYCWWQKILCHKPLWDYWYFLMLVTDFMVLWSRHKKMHKNIRTLSWMLQQPYIRLWELSKEQLLREYSMHKRETNEKKKSEIVNHSFTNALSAFSLDLLNSKC